MASKKGKKKYSYPKRNPHFFKVLLGDFEKQLKIPPNFLKYISKERSKNATLEGPNGWRWVVELSKTTKGTFLTNGWQKFVKYHSLKEHEFLVFRYDGRMRFTVLIFDTTACEREELFASRPHGRSVKLEGRNKETMVAFDIRRLDRNGGTERKFVSSDKLLTDDIIESKPLKVPSSGLIQGQCLSSTKRNSNVKIKEEDVELPLCILPQKELPLCVIASPTSSYKVYMSTRRPVTEEERLRASEAAKSFTSDLPYAVLRMSAVYVYTNHTLRLPTAFARAYLPNKRSNMILRDPSKKSWRVVYIPALRHSLSGGWSFFARGNNLEEGDYCVFELVRPLEMQVHIFRVVEEISPLVRVPRVKKMI